MDPLEKEAMKKLKVSTRKKIVEFGVHSWHFAIM
jgi:hypothetical protein